MPKGVYQHKIHRSLRERIEEKYIPEPNSGCWLWTGAATDRGYGRVWVHAAQRAIPAYRALYELENGPVPDGLELDHLCRVPACVNPAHLEPVTHKENQCRSPLIMKGAGDRMRAKTHCPQNHPYAGKNLYTFPDGRRVCRICRHESQMRHLKRKKAVTR